MSEEIEDILGRLQRKERTSQLIVFSGIAMSLMIGLALIYFYKQEKATVIDKKAELDILLTKVDTLETKNQLLESNNSSYTKLTDSLQNEIKANPKIVEEDVNNNTSSKNSEHVLIKDINKGQVVIKDYKILKRDSSFINPNIENKPTAQILSKQKTIVYIHGNGDIGNLIAQSLELKLKEKAIITPKYQVVKTKANIIKYYYDEDLAISNEVKDELNNILSIAGINNLNIRIKKDSESYLPKQRQIEVWVSY